MNARSITTLATMLGLALTQACDTTDSPTSATTPEPEIIAETISNATPEATAEALAVIQKITKISGIVDPKIPKFGESIGTPDNGSEPGRHEGGRREINWDAVPAAFSNNNQFPEDFFNKNSPRGAVYEAEGGGGLRVSSNNFSDLNPTYKNELIPFSDPRMFATTGTRVFEQEFFIPGTQIPALVRSFGAVVVDVDKPGLSRLKAFDKDGKLIANIAVPVRKNPDEYSLVGVTFTKPVIAEIQLTLGDTPPKKGVNDVSDGGTKDVVALDDLLYSEPVPRVVRQPAN